MFWVGTPRAWIIKPSSFTFKFLILKSLDLTLFVLLSFMLQLFNWVKVQSLVSISPILSHRCFAFKLDLRGFVHRLVCYGSKQSLLIWASTSGSSAWSLELAGLKINLIKCWIFLDWSNVTNIPPTNSPFSSLTLYLHAQAELGCVGSAILT